MHKPVTRQSGTAGALPLRFTELVYSQFTFITVVQTFKRKFNRVGNIWFLSPLVLSKWEDLAFSVCMLFEESVFIFQFLNNKMHNYVLFNTFVHFFIQKLKNKHTFLKTEKAKFSRRENLVFILFEEIVFFFNFWIKKCTNVLNKT